jgi:hypothetical protein
VTHDLRSEQKFTSRHATFGFDDTRYENARSDRHTHDESGSERKVK